MICPQSVVTIGASSRGPREWISRATSFLPVPFSPRIRSGDRSPLFASICFWRSRISFDLPTSTEESPASRSFRNRVRSSSFCRATPTATSAAFTRRDRSRTNSRRSTGFPEISPWKASLPSASVSQRSVATTSADVGSSLSSDISPKLSPSFIEETVMTLPAWVRMRTSARPETITLNRWPGSPRRMIASPAS